MRPTVASEARFHSSALPTYLPSAAGTGPVLRVSPASLTLLIHICRRSSCTRRCIKNSSQYLSHKDDSLISLDLMRVFTSLRSFSRFRSLVFSSIEYVKLILEWLRARTHGCIGLRDGSTSTRGTIKAILSFKSVTAECESESNDE